jgi:LPXTG-motif cell wall-anchored protein
VAPTGRYGTTPFPDLPNLFSGNQSLNSALIRLVGPGETAGILGLVLGGGLLAAAGVALWRRRRDSAIGYFDASMPLLLVTIYLVAPLSWMHHLVFVTPALLRLWADAADRGGLKEMLLVGVVGAWIGFPWPLPQLEDISPYLTLIPVPGILALWALSLRSALKAPGSAADRPGRFAIPRLLQPVHPDEARGGAAGGRGR